MSSLSPDSPATPNFNEIQSGGSVLKMASYQTVLFDIDDTLIDFKRSETLSLASTYAHFFTQVATKEAFLRDYHRINQALWKQVEEGTISSSILGSLRFQQLAELYHIPFSSDVPKYYEGQLIVNSHWIDGAKELLDALKKHKIQLGFVSNGFAHIQHAKSKSLRLSDYSDVLIISEEVGWAKPDPKIFHHTLDRLNTTSNGTLMFGDSLTSDGEGARRMGMSFCWYNPSRASAKDWLPDHILHDLTEDSVSFLLP
ncbi:MAG: YjjG family noncanonical pyrimidine nucleotidase [Verrucomicrobia bacterium]|nr:YjjG family noncanonical pyrimidine nucleotidase [Verrucomicrobiota bacterium]